MHLHMLAAVLAAVRAQGAIKTQVKILTRRVSFTVATVTMAGVNPGAVAFAAEKVGLWYGLLSLVI